jgi:hypothetical protein
MIATALVTPRPSGEDIFSGTMGPSGPERWESSLLVYNPAGGE